MAQKTVVTMVDDLTGEESGDISVVEFALDGVTYQLDLNEKNAKKLRDTLSRYTSAARRIGGRRRPGRRAKAPTSGNGSTTSYNRDTLRSIREWAKQNGHNVSGRGRLPAEVLQAWEAAHAGKSKR